MADAPESDDVDHWEVLREYESGERDELPDETREYHHRINRESQGALLDELAKGLTALSQEDDQ
ncbi:hypothetical protein ACFPYI_20950 [Halomarina salina]|uniref:Uncharacterized protein n=1 Tax=Halomarina salina TaxID=1872699 RepID=A0ABD5RTP4_9EURY|nr:hypothetical protein [Halomarina salina]